MGHDKGRVRSVLIATFTYAPDVNGVAEASSKCARALLEAGWKVDIATARSSMPRDENTLEGATIYEFDLADVLSDRFSHAAAIASYQAFLQRGSWDAIIFQGYQWPLQLAVPLLPVLGCKTVLVSHGYAALRWFPVARFPFGLGQWARSVCKSVLMLKWAPHIDRWVFLSDQRDLDAFFDHTLAHLIGHKGIEVIPNGVEPPRDAATAPSFRTSLGIPREAFFILCVGYYSRGKDQGFAVKAFRKANIPNSVLVFIGTEFNECSARFQKIDNDFPVSSKRGRILWLDKQTRENTLSAFRESDAFVLSSKLETQPISILEAMSFGKPWIGRKAGCIASLPGGICVKSQCAMARAMQTLATNSVVRSRLGATGRLAIDSNYDYARYGNTYRALLTELCL
jgi:glycosyltransferase involved in cell wall biosynthesis